MSSTTTLPRELIGNPDEDAEPEADAQTLHVAVHGAVTCNRQTAVLAHPLVWMAAGLLVFTAAILFPPDLYARLFAETSAMYLDPLSSIYTLSCVGLILAGLWCGLGGSFSTIPPRTLVGTDLDQLPVTGHGLLVLLTLGNITSSLLFVRFGGLRVLLEAIQGTEKLDRGMRNMVDDSGGQLWLATIALSSVFAPVAYQMARSVYRHPMTRPLVAFFVVTYVIAALLGSRRNYISRPLFGILLAWLVWPPVRQFTLRKAMLAVAGTAAVMFALFGILAVLRRGLAGASDIVTEAVRYILTPYNTQSLIMHDAVQMPGAGKGYYWTEWFWQFPVLENLVDLEALRNSWFGERALTGVRERSPVLVEQGIETGTAMPAFVCSWVDLGWFGILPFFVVGLVCAMCWKGFLRGASIPMMFYSMIAYSFVEWRANLTFPSVMTSYGLIIAAVIQIGRFVEAPRQR